MKTLGSLPPIALPPSHVMKNEMAIQLTPAEIKTRVQHYLILSPS
jgi:hypothetical protein